MKIGFTCSAFDLLHAGHIQMLRDAKSQCDYLICGLQVDPAMDRDSKNSPVQTIVERYIQLAAVSYVDEIKDNDSTKYPLFNECADVPQVNKKGLIFYS